MELIFHSAFKAYLHVLRCEEKHCSNGTDQDSHPVWPSEEYIEGNTDTNNLWEIRDNDGELSNNPGDQNQRLVLEHLFHAFSEGCLSNHRETGAQNLDVDR